MMTIPIKQVEDAIADAVIAAKRTGRPQFVRIMNWEDLYADIGITDDPEFQIGKHWATVGPDGTVERLWKEKA